MKETQPKSITVMKYLARDGSYKFTVKDEFSFPDMLDRQDYMCDLRASMVDNGEMIKHIWTKEVFPA